MQTIVAARVDIHKNPPLKLDPSEFRVKKGTSKEVEEQLALERKRMEVAEAKQVGCHCTQHVTLVTRGGGGVSSLAYFSLQREEIAQIAQAEIAKVQMMNKVTAKLEALAVKERERKKVPIRSFSLVFKL